MRKIALIGIVLFACFALISVPAFAGGGNSNNEQGGNKDHGQGQHNGTEWNPGNHYGWQGDGDDNDRPKPHKPTKFGKADAYTDITGFGQEGVDEDGNYVSNGGTVFGYSEAKAKTKGTRPYASVNAHLSGNVHHGSYEFENHAGSNSGAHVNASANSFTGNYNKHGWCWWSYWSLDPAKGRHKLVVEGVAEQFNASDITADNNEFNWASAYNMTGATFYGELKGKGWTAWLEGYASAHGFTDLYVFTSEDGTYSTAYGMTSGNSNSHVYGWLFPGCGTQKDFQTTAYGQGGIMTATFASAPGMFAATFTDSNFMYNNSGNNSASGSGWATGSGTSHVTKSGNGFRITAHSSASAGANTPNQIRFDRPN